jgi:hypothetical protein
LSHACRVKVVKALLVCGVLAGPVFTLGWLVGGAVRADYDPLRHFVSSLSIGPQGWTQIAVFVVTGALLVAFAVGLRLLADPASGRVFGPLAFGLIGLALIGAGVFVTDPLLGYPPGSPLIPTIRTTSGLLHDLCGVPFFLGLPLTCFQFGRRFAKQGERGWAGYSALSGVAMLAAFIAARAGVRASEDFGYAGLLQRVTLVAGFAWTTLIAARMLRVNREPPLSWPTVDK